MSQILTLKESIGIQKKGKYALLEKRLKSLHMYSKKLTTLLKRFSNRANFHLSKHIGSYLPFYYVCEYPRSGGTWIAHMLSDYLQIPFPKESLFPIGYSSIIHNHWSYSRKLSNPIYVLRDGRDVAVSMMFFASKNIKRSLAPQRYYRKRYPSLFKYPLDSYGEIECFKHFLSDWMSNGTGTKLDWKSHILQWIDRPNVILVKYEDFFHDSKSALKELLGRLDFVSVDEEMLTCTINKFSFFRQTGRRTGEENIYSNKRKGIIGDWRNYFDKNLADSFFKYAGDILVKIGYEKDNDWILDF